MNQILGSLSTSSGHSTSDDTQHWNSMFAGDDPYSQTFEVFANPAILYAHGLVGDDLVVLENVIMADDGSGSIAFSTPIALGNQVFSLFQGSNMLAMATPGRFRLRLITGDPSLVRVQKYRSELPSQNYFDGQMMSLRTPTAAQQSIIWMGAPPI